MYIFYFTLHYTDLVYSVFYLGRIPSVSKLGMVPAFFNLPPGYSGHGYIPLYNVMVMRPPNATSVGHFIKQKLSSDEHNTTFPSYRATITKIRRPHTG